MPSAVEIVNGLPALHQGGDYRVLGCLEELGDARFGFPLYKGSNYPVLTPDQWQECDYRPFRAGPTKDQKQTSSCTGHATSTTFEYQRVYDGMPKRVLSASFPYAHVNGGKDQGASVSAIMQVLQQAGDCPVELCPLEDLFMNQVTASAVAAAQDYKVLEAVRCRSFAEFCSALTLFGPAPFGIMIGQNFGKLDRNGVCPQIDMTLGGHALSAVGLKLIGGQWHILFENSWTANWGMDGGFAYVNEGHFQRMTDGFGIISAKSSDKPDDGDEPPKVKLRLLDVLGRGPVSVSVPEDVRVAPEEVPEDNVSAALVKKAEELKDWKDTQAKLEELRAAAPSQTKVDQLPLPPTLESVLRKDLTTDEKKEILLNGWREEALPEVTPKEDGKFLTFLEVPGGPRDLTPNENLPATVLADADARSAVNVQEEPAVLAEAVPPAGATPAADGGLKEAAGPEAAQTTTAPEEPPAAPLPAPVAKPNKGKKGK